MLEKMFHEGNDDFYDDGSISPAEELLAEGTYKSEADQIIAGYKIYQKKYVIGRMLFRLALVLIAIASCLLMIITNEKAGERAAAPYFFIAVAAFIAVYFVQQPIANMKKLKAGISELEGTEYKAQFFTDKLVISTIVDNNVENFEKTDDTEQENTDDTAETEEEDSRPPATVIHLNSYIVDLLDKDDMFIVCVRKSYVFIIPKKAFKPYDVMKIKDRLSVLMGIRYKPI
jgi:hypothetical protein